MRDDDEEADDAEDEEAEEEADGEGASEATESTTDASATDDEATGGTGETESDVEADETPAAKQPADRATAGDEEAASETGAGGSSEGGAPSRSAHATDPVGDETAQTTDDPDKQERAASADRGAASRSPDRGAASGSADRDAATESASEQRTTTPTQTPVSVGLVTIGTTGDDTDPAGDRLVTAFESVGHTVAVRERLRGDYDGIQQSVDTLTKRDDVEVVVTVGGTGIRAEEEAIEAVHPLFEKALPGFGEAYRLRLRDHIGTGIVGVRSTAGVADGTPVFCLPGDPGAAALAVDEIIAGEAPVLVAELA